MLVQVNAIEGNPRPQRIKSFATPVVIFWLSFQDKPMINSRSINKLSLFFVIPGGLHVAIVTKSKMPATVAATVTSYLGKLRAIRKAALTGDRVEPGPPEPEPLRDPALPVSV